MYTKVFRAMYQPGCGRFVLVIDYYINNELVAVRTRILTEYEYRRISMAANKRAAAERGRMSAAALLPGWAYWEKINA